MDPGLEELLPSLGPGWRVTVAEPPARPALADLDAAIGDALARPLASPRLRELAERAADRARAEGRRPAVTIAVTDATRDCPDDRFLPPLLGELEAGGIAPAEVTIVVATGLHRASTADEKRRMLGEAIAERYRVVDHDARDRSLIVDLGRTTGGIPMTTNRLASGADLLVATGVVEPHQYAGYSGGAKTVAIGVAGEPTIAATHAIAMLDEPGVRLGRLEGNPFHDTVVEIGRAVGLDFVINVVADADARPLAVAAGRPEETHRALVEVAATAFTVPLVRQAHVAVAGVPASKGANLYQATRAVTYLHYAPVPVVRRGGAYILPASIPEGAGGGLGERRFFEALRGAGSPDELIERLRRDGTLVGEQRAYLVASVMRDAAILVVGAEHPDVAEACGMRAVATLSDAMALADRLVRPRLVRPPAEHRRGTRRLDLLVVRDAIRTLPVFVSAAPGSAATLG